MTENRKKQADESGRRRGDHKTVFNTSTLTRRSTENVIATNSCKTERRPRDHFQVETITTKSPSSGLSCLDSTHCITMARGSEANCSSTVEQHRTRQRTWGNDQEVRREKCQASRIQTSTDQSLQLESDVDGLKSRILQDWWTWIEAGTGTLTVLSVSGLTPGRAENQVIQRNCAAGSVTDPETDALPPADYNRNVRREL